MSNEQETNIQLSKSFPASKHELYNAWTSPEELKQWWRPMNKQLLEVENNITQGGKVKYLFEDDLKIAGEYKEVEEGNRLVYSWNWEHPEESLHKGEYLLTVTFNEDGNGSQLEITQENFKEEHAIKPHQSGWEEMLQNLSDHLAEKKAV